MKNATFLLLALAISVAVSAQSGLGSIRGKILNGDESMTPIPGARAWIEVNGTKRIVLCDSAGRFKFEALDPGTYNLFAKSTGKDTFQLTGVEVHRDKITILDDIGLTQQNLKMITIVYTPPLIIRETGRVEIAIKDIQHSPNVLNPKALFASFNSDVQIKEGTGDMIIRGSRPNDVIYYIDGVKVADLTGVPGCAIGGMMGYTGGIPAKYGDTTGGVVALETKSYFDLYYQWKAKQ